MTRPTLAEAWAGTSGALALRQAQLRALMVEAVVPIRAGAIKKLWSRWMVLARCELFVLDNAPTALGPEYTPMIHTLRVVCQATVRNLMDDVFSDIDMTDAEAAADATGYLDALVFAGVLTIEQRAATLALGKIGQRVFGDAEIDAPALYAAGLISAAEAGLRES